MQVLIVGLVGKPGPRHGQAGTRASFGKLLRAVSRPVRQTQTLRVWGDGFAQCVKARDQRFEMGVQPKKDGTNVFGIGTTTRRNHLQTLIRTIQHFQVIFQLEGGGQGKRI